MKKSLAGLLFAIVAGTTMCYGALIRVPADQPTIQAGIAAAGVSGDTVMVASGAYIGTGNRDIDFSGKQVAVISEFGPELTIIDCQGTPAEHHIGFSFHSGETNAVLDGFTIMHAYATTNMIDSAAIFCLYGGPTIRNCVVSDNVCTGIMMHGGSPKPTVTNCVVIRNTGSGIVAGIGYPSFGDANITHCLSAHNGGSGIVMYRALEATIANCTVVSNHDQGIMLWGDPPKSVDAKAQLTTINNNIIAFNQQHGIARMMWWPDEALSITCNDAYGNVGSDYYYVPAAAGDTLGNISLNPLFCDTTADNYHIADGSPCAPALSPCQLLIGKYPATCSGNFVCGDADGSGIVNVSDAVYLMSYIFGGGPAPSPLAAGDVDCSGHINITDAVYLISYVFGNGPTPCANCK